MSLLLERNRLPCGLRIGRKGALTIVHFTNLHQPCRRTKDAGEKFLTIAIFTQALISFGILMFMTQIIPAPSMTDDEEAVAALGNSSCTSKFAILDRLSRFGLVHFSLALVGMGVETMACAHVVSGRYGVALVLDAPKGPNLMSAGWRTAVLEPIVIASLAWLVPLRLGLAGAERCRGKPECLHHLSQEPAPS